MQPRKSKQMIKKVISGGQTGVDQAALDAAIACGVEYGGWIPAGRKTENGPLPMRYALVELESESYPVRTQKNIVEADATLIISHGPLAGGSALTANIAQKMNIPYMHVDLDTFSGVLVLQKIKAWLQENQPVILNVAGPRASSDSRIYQESYDIIVELLKANNNNAST